MCKSCRTCIKFYCMFYCMFYFTCDRSFNVKPIGSICVLRYSIDHGYPKAKLRRWRLLARRVFTGMTTFLSINEQYHNTKARGRINASAGPADTGQNTGGRRSVAPGTNDCLAAPPCPRSQLTRKCGELPSMQLRPKINLVLFKRHRTPLVDGHR